LRDSLTIDMLLSAVSVLVVAQSSSEVPEGLMNNSVHHVRRKFISRLLSLYTRQDEALQNSIYELRVGGGGGRASELPRNKITHPVI